jgi:inhibitor of cysteine peptidase
MFYNSITKVILFLLILVFICMVPFCFARKPGEAKVIKTQVGKNFIIVLKANATTGYQWQFAQPLDENMLKLIRLEYEQDNRELIGAGGKQVWSFKALRAGRTIICFKYVRPWEKNILPVKEESFVVVIKG